MVAVAPRALTPLLKAEETQKRAAGAAVSVTLMAAIRLAAGLSEAVEAVAAAGVY